MARVWGASASLMRLWRSWVQTQSSAVGNLRQASFSSAVTCFLLYVRGETAVMTDVQMWGNKDLWREKTLFLAPNFPGLSFEINT